MDYKIILPEEVPATLVNRLTEIEEFKGRWTALNNLAPDRLDQFKRVAAIASIGSSTRIEGVKLSNEEVEALLSNIGSHHFRSRDEEEVAGYAEAMNTVFDHFVDIPVIENHIKQLHRILLRYSTKDERHAGEYKKLSNNVEAFDAAGKSVGIVFETASPFMTPYCMASLTAWYEKQIKERTHHPLLVIGTWIVHFLAIHPFQDGNGRLSRILTTLMLLQQGYAYVPYCSLESIVEENRDRYYLALRRAQESFKTDHGRLNEWLMFFLSTLVQQKKILDAKVADEVSLSMAGLPAESVKILEIVQDRGKTTIANIIHLTGAKRNTAKTRLKDLVARGLLVRHGVGKGSWYSKGGHPEG
ncbi:MAG: Fic family protein [Chitinispirillaceae bacterium]|nr:Fic family protein [Chitinispirillaceae bacterium]